MNYKQFQQRLVKSLLGIDIKNQYQVGYSVVRETVDNLYVANNKTFTSFSQASDYIKNNKLTSLFDNIQHMPDDHVIASLIRDHHNVKVTDTLIESIKSIVETKQFSLDPVVETMKTNVLFDDKLEFVLEDQSVVFIDRSTFKRLNTIFAEHSDIISFMKQSSKNLMLVVEKLQSQR